MTHATKTPHQGGRTTADRTGFGRVYGAPSSYSPTFVEEEFSEVRLLGILGSSYPGCCIAPSRHPQKHPLQASHIAPPRCPKSSLTMPRCMHLLPENVPRPAIDHVGRDNRAS